MQLPIRRPCMRNTTTDIKTLKSLYAEMKDAALKDYFKFLSFQSISTEKEYQSQVVACAKWLANYLKEMGFKTEFWSTPVHPVIFASRMDGGPDTPTLLIYNHYDVQPVDPLELWDSPPFEPEVRGGQVYARGAQDNKGQCFYVLQALKLLIKKAGKLPINVKLCIEGEEEGGSAGLATILHQKKNPLKADYLAIVDLGMGSLEKPSMVLGARGIVTMDLEIQGSQTDLHSGAHGGIAYNPIHALVEILAKLRDENGKITVPGFYDDVLPLSDKELAMLDLEFDKQQYVQTFHATPNGGEKNFSPLQRGWMRPTLEINGIKGGYTGSGFKTVIPAKAYAKLSCRLVPNQTPQAVAQKVLNYIKTLAPEGMTVTANIRPGTGTAVHSSVSSPGIRAFAQAYQEIFSSPVSYVLEGGSIPIINQLKEASQSSVVMVGLGLADDQIHAPNEHFGLDRLEQGCCIMARAMEILSSRS